MKISTLRLLTAVLFSVAILTGCASKGSEFLGSWINTRNPTDTFQIVRNGDQFLIVTKGNKVGASYDKGMLDIKGTLVSTELTYDKRTGTIVTLGLFGAMEYKRKN
jgi:hypothetical protein